MTTTRFRRTAPAGAAPAMPVPSRVRAVLPIVEAKQMGEYLTASELRHLFVREDGKVTPPETVKSWIGKGLLRAVAVGPRGVHLFRRADAEALRQRWDPATGRLERKPAREGARAKDAAKIENAMREHPEDSRLSLSRRTSVNYRWVYRYIEGEMKAGRIRQVDGRWEIGT